MLTRTESRVLGVLVEKAHTTPGQYPLTLNAVVTGCNQKSNRDPVTRLSEDQVVSALDGLRAKDLAREVMMTGSRVEKFRHIARETLGIGTAELVVLTELLLRGPQTLGELRTRASRMHPLESMEIVRNVLEHLAAHDPPLVRSIAPASGSRAGRFGQLLCRDLHPIDAPAAGTGAASSPSPPATRTPVAPDDGLAARVERLESRVEELARLLARLETAHGMPPLHGTD